MPCPEPYMDMVSLEFYILNNYLHDEFIKKPVIKIFNSLQNLAGSKIS